MGNGQGEHPDKAAAQDKGVPHASFVANNDEYPNGLRARNRRAGDGHIDDNNPAGKISLTRKPITLKNPHYYLKTQNRFRHLTQQDVEHIIAMRDNAWKRMLENWDTPKSSKTHS